MKRLSALYAAMLSQLLTFILVSGIHAQENVLAPKSLPARSVASPDGRYVMTVNGMTYAVTFNGKALVCGDLGIDIDNRLFESALAVPRGENDDWCSDLVLRAEERTSADTTWTPLYGENARIRDHYNQLTLHYEKGNREGTADEAYDKRKFYAMDIIVRAYDEGIAFRYHFPETTNNLFLHITSERTSFRMPEGTMAWYEEWAQGPYVKRQLALNRPLPTVHCPLSIFHSPLSIVQSEEGSTPWLESERPLLMAIPNTPRPNRGGAGGGATTYVALLEAAMKDFARGKFRLKGDNELQVALYGSIDIIPAYDTPWRVIMASERAIDLINHKDIILNLNAPADSSLFHSSLVTRHSSFVTRHSSFITRHSSFIKPGKAFRSCRLDKANIFRSIDFCKAFGIDYVELDAGWYGPEGQVSSDARKVIETRDFTMEEVCAYARNQGIGVWLYVNQRALYRQLDDLLPLYRQWGISGIKFGFVQVGNQQWSTWLHDAVAKCAEYQLMVDIHDEYRPTGLSRTYPNLLTQEGIRGNEEMPDATHNVTLPFTRFLCGPGDYTLCYFDRRIKTTRAHQLAMAAVYYSPLQFLFWYDNPFTDGWDAEELQFWHDCPTVFDESIALDGMPGEYIIQARRAGNDWFVGAMTNTDARTVTISTDFLPTGRYEVTIYEDDPTRKALSVKRSTLNAKRGKPITLQLQPSGGAALHFRMKTS